jgi:PBP1b-binding outer membrane lipoprotein LpoB
MVYKGWFQIVRCSTLLWLIVFLGACSQNMEPAQNPEQYKKGPAMNLEHMSHTPSPKIPAIDATVPVNLETAAFGLG